MEPTETKIFRTIHIFFVQKPLHLVFEAIQVKKEFTCIFLGRNFNLVLQRDLIYRNPIYR
jgi:hypothetical protein